MPTPQLAAQAEAEVPKSGSAPVIQQNVSAGGGACCACRAAGCEASASAKGRESFEPVAWPFPSGFGEVRPALATPKAGARPAFANQP